MCNLIVDIGNTENLVSQKLVDYLKLSTKPHDKPYTLGSVSKGSQNTSLESSYLHQKAS